MAEKKDRSRSIIHFSLSDAIPILKNTFKVWSAHDPFRQSAAMAYYAIFSLPALLVIVIAAAGFIAGEQAITGQLSAQFSKLMGQDTALQIQEMVAHASIDDKSIWATMLAVIILLIGATGVFAQLQKAFNVIWEVKAVPNKGIVSFLQTRLISFGMIISIGFLLIISLVVTTLITLVGVWLQKQIPGMAIIILQIVNFILSTALTVLLFALMFKFLPDAKINWRDVWGGAIVTALLFSLGKFALGLYFGKAQPTETYGAAGSVILIMLWVFYSCIILFFGAEFTRQNVEWQGRSVKPRQHAVKDPEAELLLKK